MSVIRIALAVALSMLAVVEARAQVGEQPIRIVIPYPAGGAGDATARMIAESMRTSLRRPVIVENKPGAAGRLGVVAVKEGPADGSVLLFTPIAPMAVFPHVYDKLGYDPVADFAPISQVAAFDLGIAVGANVSVEIAGGAGSLAEEEPEPSDVRQSCSRLPAALLCRPVRANGKCRPPTRCLQGERAGGRGPDWWSPANILYIHPGSG